GALRNGVEYRLDIGPRATDDPQDLAGGRLLIERLGQRLAGRSFALQCLHFELQRFRQALLKVTDPTTPFLGRRAGALGSDFPLRGLCVPRHPSLLASRRATADDRLCERATLGKGKGGVGVCERAGISVGSCPEGVFSPAGASRTSPRP